VWAVVFIVRLALGTFRARLNLSSDTNTVTWLDSLDLTNDLMANTDGCVSNIPQPPVIVWISEPQTPRHSLSISTSWSSKILGVNCETIKYRHSILQFLATWYGTMKMSAAFSVCNERGLREVRKITFSLVKTPHLMAEWIMNPSNFSGADTNLDDSSVFNFLIRDYSRVISGVCVVL
jgi:hypothetical protein